MQLGFYFDQTRCIACNTCTVACRDWNQLKPGPVRYRKVTVTETGSNADTVVYNLSMACNHCEKPACVDACPTKAIVKREADGVVIIDKTVCISAGLCVDACPYAQPQIADDKQESAVKANWKVQHPAQKCTFCWDRLEDGQKPVCVAGCPARALDCGDMEELSKKYPDAVLASKGSVPGMPDTKGTAPSFLVKVKGKTPIVDVWVDDI